MNTQLHPARPASILFDFLVQHIICFFFFGSSVRLFSNFKMMSGILCSIPTLEAILAVEGFGESLLEKYWFPHRFSLFDLEILLFGLC
jgi:hypothetical protein